ncbi:MAG: endoglucanase [Eubacteriales bacterium]|nr:endoglucanase [Eubacteriales bacterium]MDD3881284.1 endoglucanase [Eubacteriales bacterium]MDD4512202.1 endoglucanase [Eubacteriales bacterium]
MQAINAAFHHLPIPGGGFVTGFIFHPNFKDVLYARTDIGGCYRFDFAARRWISLAESIPYTEKYKTYPLSIAVKDDEREFFAFACGDRERSALAVSRDMGESFEYHDIPAFVHGNYFGRGTGERLVYLSDGSGMLFASQSEGLMFTPDEGRSWEKREIVARGGKPESNCSFIYVDKKNPKLVIIGTSGEENSPDGKTRGASVYYSRDGGINFDILPNQRAPLTAPECTHYGYVAQRAVSDGEYIYITFNMPSFCWAGFKSYACDTGASYDGYVLRIKANGSGEITEAREITPRGVISGGESSRAHGSGLAGIECFPNHPGSLLCTSICSNGHDRIYFSQDCGESWKVILEGLETGKIDFSSVSYMQPKYNGGGSIVHWMSDIKIDSHNENFALFNTGTGIFASFDMKKLLCGEYPTFRPLCDGLEETVHLNVYAPPSGKAVCVDIIGDLGGFAFTETDKQCENSFDNENGDRYITAMNADYSDADPDYAVITPRGNWTGRTKGGLIVTKDGYKTFARLPMPFGISSRLDEKLHKIEQPNVNSGWAAMTADKSAIIWAIAEGNDLPCGDMLITKNEGKEWKECEIRTLSGEKTNLKPISDRLDSSLVYGLGSSSRVFVSRDGGETFREHERPSNLPKRELGGIDGNQPCQIWAESGKSGEIFISMSEDGLWRLTYNKASDSFSAEKVSREGDNIYRFGFGMPLKEGMPKAIYASGIIGGVCGFYASFDEGKSFIRVGDDKHLYGDIRAIAGDMRKKGRFYIATGTLGLLFCDAEV